MSYDHHSPEALDAAFFASGYADRAEFNKYVVSALLAYVRTLPKITGEEGLQQILERRAVYSASSEEARILDVAIATIEDVRQSEAISESNSAYNFLNIEYVTNFLICETEDFEVLDGHDLEPLGAGKSIIAHIQKLYERISDLERAAKISP